MGKRKKHQQPNNAATLSASSVAPSSSKPKTANALELILLVLAGIGILLTSYLTYVAWFEAHPAFCSEGSGV